MLFLASRHNQYVRSIEPPIIHEKTKIVRILLEYGIRVPKKYSTLAEKGWLTPHGNRINYNNREISTLLTQAYRKQQAVKKFVHNALHFPTQHHKTKLISTLLSSGI